MNKKNLRILVGLLLVSLFIGGCKVPVVEEVVTPEPVEVAPVEEVPEPIKPPVVEEMPPEEPVVEEPEEEMTLIPVEGEADGLTEEGKAALALHYELFNSVTKKYPRSMNRQVNSDVSVLTELVIYENDEGIKLTEDIPIPADVVQHLARFSHIRIEGERLGKVTRPMMVSTKGSLKLKGVSRADEKAVLLTRGLPKGVKAVGPWSLKLSGLGVVKKVTLSSSGVYASFDRTPYMSGRAGAESRKVEVKISAITGRTIEGIGELSRERYFRLYEAPGMDRSGLVADLEDKGFLPGRQITKIRPALEERTWDAHSPKLVEDANRPGYADLSYFKKKPNANYPGVDRKLKFAMCFDSWPSWMDVNYPDEFGRGTPKDFKAAAELAAAYVQSDLKDSKLSATWWEVKNESDIQEEWAYHRDRKGESWSLLAEFHNEMASAIHSVAPEVKVGGPTSAWFHPEKGAGGFNQWRTHSEFMDATREHLDFYGHHFYDGSVMDTYKGLWSGYSGYAQGKLECMVDMLKAYMIATDNVKPIVVSEHGALNGDRGDADFWMRLKAYNHNLITFMDRPADFAITVPFLLGFTHWEPNSGHGLIDVDENRNYEFNHNIHFVNMWEGVKGHRLLTLDDEPKLHVRSFLDDRNMYIALNNRTGDSLSVDLGLQLPQGSTIEKVMLRAIRYTDEQLVYIDEEFANDLAQIPLISEETAVLHLKLNRPTAIQRTVNETSCYATKTVVEARGTVNFEVVVPSKALSLKRAPAVLRVGLQNSGGFDGALEVKFNGKSYRHDLAWTDGIDNFFDYVEFTIPAADVRAKNEVIVKSPTSGAMITSTKLILKTLHAKRP